ncbi:MAG: hypothetical protein J6Q15_02550 [Clostridia bacterium]|nr:hypothetical protein [Clostridia bacterium]
MTTKTNKYIVTIIALLIVIIGMATFSVTYAYFSSKTETIKGEFATATIELTTNKTTFQTSINNVLPGGPIVNDEIVVTPNLGVKAILIAYLQISAPGVEFGAEDIVFSVSAGWEKVELIDGVAYVYNADTTNSQYYVEGTIPITFIDSNSTIYLDKDVDAGSNGVNMGKTISIELTFYATQYNYLSGVNGQEFTGSTAKECYSAVRTHVHTSLPDVKITE